MKLLPVLLLACLAVPAAADALGDSACAEAEVAGRITRQDYRTFPSTPDAIRMDVLLLIDFDVRRVRFGPVRKGRLRIEAISPEQLNDGHEIALYLHRRADKSWWIADCRNR